MGQGFGLTQRKRVVVGTHIKVHKSSPDSIKDLHTNKLRLGFHWCSQLAPQAWPSQVPWIHFNRWRNKNLFLVSKSWSMHGTQNDEEKKLTKVWQQNKPHDVVWLKPGGCVICLILKWQVTCLKRNIVPYLNIIYKQVISSASQLQTQKITYSIQILPVMPVLWSRLYLQKRK